MAELLRPRVKSVQPAAKGSNPQISGRVFVQGEYSVVAQAGRILWIVAVMSEAGSTPVFRFAAESIQTASP